jgi:hypothetical protein
VAKIFKAKYYPNSDFLRAKQSHNSSFSWQSIQKASWLLKKDCRWIIGDGKSIDIWKDSWIHPQFGSTTSTKQPDDTTFHRVSDLIDNQNRCWKDQIIRQIFYPTEADQICFIPITNTNHDDILSWQGTKDGIYSVRSGSRQSWNGKTAIKLTLLAPTMRITPDGKRYGNFLFPLSSFTSYGEFLIMPSM